MEIWFPRTCLSPSIGSAIKSSSLKRMAPEGCEAAGYGSSRRIDSAVTVLPEPDSPTSATVSALPISKEICLTAWVVLPPLRKATERSSTETRGAPFAGGEGLLSAMHGTRGLCLARIGAFAVLDLDRGMIQ